VHRVVDSSIRCYTSFISILIAKSLVRMNSTRAVDFSNLHIMGNVNPFLVKTCLDKDALLLCKTYPLPRTVFTINWFAFPIICRYEKYTAMVEFMCTNDLVMRTLINDVELLVLASTTLHNDSQSMSIVNLYIVFLFIETLGNIYIIMLCRR